MIPRRVNSQGAMGKPVDSHSVPDMTTSLGHEWFPRIGEENGESPP